MVRGGTEDATEMLPLNPGTVVAGRYLLKRELARGCMGAVWVGLDKRLRRPVAVKLMKLKWAGRGEARVRFEREAMAVAQLRSPHIVQIFDYGIDHDIPFIVMEMLDGYDLHAQLKRVKALAFEQTVQLVTQAAKGLAAAHEVNIIHRDLKPANLFIVRSGDDELLKLLDFGVAKADVKDEDDDEEEEEVTKVGMVLGTPQYMAPEQARGLANIDHRADLWSLGVIAYRCLTGRLPFTGKNVTEVIVGMLSNPAPPPSGFAPHLPPGIDEFFARALATDPTHRFGSAREMAAALSAFAPESFPSVSMAGPPAAGAGAGSAILGQTPLTAAPSVSGEPSLDGSWGEWGTPPPSLPGSGTSPGTMDTFPSGAQWVPVPDPQMVGDGGNTGAPGDTGAAMPAEALAAQYAQQQGMAPKRWPLALKLAALSFVALALGAGAVFVILSRNPPPTANAASEPPEPEPPPGATAAAAATEREGARPTADGTASAEAATSASAEPDEVAEADPTAEPSAEPPPKKKPATGGTKPGGAKPKGTGGKKPPPKPPPKPKQPDPDPFSERL